MFLLECYDGIMPLKKEDWCENDVILLTSLAGVFYEHISAIQRKSFLPKCGKIFGECTLQLQY